MEAQGVQSRLTRRSKLSRPVKPRPPLRRATRRLLNPLRSNSGLVRLSVSDQVRLAVTEAAAAGSDLLAEWVVSDSVTTLCPSTLPTWQFAERRTPRSLGVAELRSRLRFLCNSRDRRSRPEDGAAGAEGELIGAEVQLGDTAPLQRRRMARHNKV